MRELVAVGPEYAELFVDGVVRRYEKLSPSTNYEFDGVALRTLDSVGDLLSRVVTMNDVHFGEIECGKIGNDATHALRVGHAERAYPEVMNESVIADALATKPDAVIVKGDLTSFGTLEEYATFRSFYVGAFGDLLTYVRGNHDSYPGNVYADWPVQLVHTPGVAVLVLDTARLHETGGFVSADQCAAVKELAEASSDPVLVMGHHPLFVPGVDRLAHFDGVVPEDSAALIKVMAKADNVLAYSAGHTHRCRRRDVDGVAIIEVACTKDFPGAWAEYLIGTRGIAQVVHRASGAAAIAWAERTRTMFDGYYGTYALGELSDRCFVLPFQE